MVLLMAGHEAVVNATANGIALLAAHPDQWRHIVSGEVEPRAAIEEILRFDPPLQWFTRWVLDDGFTVDGIGSARLPGRAGARGTSPSRERGDAVDRRVRRAELHRGRSAFIMGQSVSPANGFVGDFLGTFLDYPRRMKAASSTIDQVQERLEAAIASGD